MDGTGIGGEDYVEIHTVLTFPPGETEQEVEVEVIDDVEWEPDEDFFLKVKTNADNNPTVRLLLYQEKITPF